MEEMNKLSLVQEKEFLDQIAHLEDRANFLEKKLTQVKRQGIYPIILFLHGIIGCGKTTIGRALVKQIEGAVFIPEPIEVNGFITQKTTTKKIFF